MKKITLCIFGFLAFSLGALAQFSFPAEAGPILVAQGAPVTININDAANVAGVPVTDYLSFSVSADWVSVDNAWSNEADLTITTSAGSVLIDPATSGAGTGAPTTLVFEGEFTALYNPGTDGTLDIILNQSFNASSANWSNITVTINEPPSCITPADLAAGNFTSTAAELSWTDAGATGLYDVEFLDVTAGDMVTGTPTDTGVANPFTKMGLTEGNDYSFYVRADCGGSGVSDWAGPFNFSLNLPPANDECDNAVALTVNGDFACGNVTAGTTVGATASPQADDVTGTPNNDVWFSFVATGASHRIALLNVTAVVGTSVDMGMGVYDATGGCDALILVGDSDPNTLNLSGLTAGVTYLVRVYGWGATNSAQANFDICVGTPPSETADFVNLQFPFEATIEQGNTADVFAQIFEAGITEPAGQGAGIEAWIGVSDTDATTTADFETADWTWITATYNVDNFNNDEYQAAIGAGLAPGTYFYVSRFSVLGGPFSYGGINPGGSDGNFWDGTNYVSGVLTVNAPPPPACGGQFFDTGGPSGNYSADENTTTTIFPDVAGDAVTVTFTFVDIETSGFGSGTQDGCWDFLTIYDGPDTSAPVLAQTLCGEESGDGGVPSVASSLLSVNDSFTSSHPSGALTFVFTSDSSVQVGGWAADVTCATLSIDDFTTSNFTFYPNPVKNTLTLTAQNNIQNITVFNMLGQAVLKVSPNATTSDIDMSNLGAGTYFAQVTINNVTNTIKVLKQ